MRAKFFFFLCDPLPPTLNPKHWIFRVCRVFRLSLLGRGWRLNRHIIRKLPIMHVGLLSLPSDVNVSLVSKTRNAPFASRSSRLSICCCTARPPEYVEEMLQNSSSNALLLKSSGGCLLVQSKSRNCMVHCVYCSESMSPVSF